MKQPLLVIAGPTASGKTALAVALSERLGGEVVSADSMQVYRDIPIATACPTAEERRGIPHHLQEFLPLTEPFSVARYATLARETIAAVHARDRLPVLCGGTGLYIAAVTDNVQYEAQDDAATASVRARLQDEAARLGDRAMWDKLAAVDPELAAKLHIHDRSRVLRGLEVFETAGEPLSVLQKKQVAVPSPYGVCMILLDFRDRARLYDRIDRRVDIMMESGLLEETAKVVRLTAPTAQQAIGCKELRPYFDGECTLSEALDTMKRRSRQYAKRQLSWFRRIPYAHTFYVDDYGSSQQLIEAVQTAISF